MLRVIRRLEILFESFEMKCAQGVVLKSYIHSVEVGVLGVCEVALQSGEKTIIWKDSELLGLELKN